MPSVEDRSPTRSPAVPADVRAPRWSSCTNRKKLYSAEQEPLRSALNRADFQAFLSYTSKPRGQRGLLQFKNALRQFGLTLFPFAFRGQAELSAVAAPIGSPPPPGLPSPAPGMHGTGDSPARLRGRLQAHSRSQFGNGYSSLRFYYLLAVRRYS